MVPALFDTADHDGVSASVAVAVLPASPLVSYARLNTPPAEQNDCPLVRIASSTLTLASAAALIVYAAVAGAVPSRLSLDLTHRPKSVDAEPAVALPCDQNKCTRSDDANTTLSTDSTCCVVVSVGASPMVVTAPAVVPPAMRLAATRPYVLPMTV